jgi:sarcosine oxidase subunit beta
VAAESADVVVVGGGAVGASVAWHLTELGVADVLVLERDTLAAGSTSKSAGGIRAQFADDLNLRIALRSLAELEAFEERFGVDIAFHQTGYLFLIDDEGDLARFREALELQHAHGIPSRELAPAEALELVPQLDLDGILAATFCPRDGHASPEAVVQGYAAAAAARGVRVRQRCAVTGIDVRGGRIHGVETSAGRVETGVVVCAAGAWSREVAALAGVELPVEGEPRTMWFSPQAGGIGDRCPLTIDFGSGFYFHREGPGLVFGGREATLDEVAEAGLRRLPLLADLPIQSSWWGFYEQSPDHNALVGEAGEPSRFLYATGFSGHGFQQAPAVGEHVAELVAGREPTLDLSPFGVERFAAGLRREERFVV